MYLIIQGHEKWKWSVVLHNDFTTETFWFDHPKKAFKFAVSKAPQCNEKELPYCRLENYIMCCGKNKWYYNELKCTAQHAYLEIVADTGFYSEWEDDIY